MVVGGDLRKIVAICERYCCSDQITMMPILLRIARSRPMEDNIIDDWVMTQAIGPFRRGEALSDTLVCCDMPDGGLSANWMRGFYVGKPAREPSSFVNCPSQQASPTAEPSRA
jgi:hypothetical protein